MVKNNIKVLDLFSGCGGLSFGFLKQGFQVIAGIDNWKDSLLTFEKNHPGAKGIFLDLSDFDEKELKEMIGPIDIIIGGPPCQGFSISGKRNPDDPRNKLYAGFVKAVKYFSPKAFILENVPNLVSMDNGKIKDSILKGFKKLGYEVKYKILLASDYGVPQNRRRVVFVGIKGNNNFEFPVGNFIESKSKITCSAAISDLPEFSVKDGSVNKRSPQSDYQTAMRIGCLGIYNHQITDHDDKTVSIISLVPDGGNYKDLPAELQGTRNMHIAWTRFASNRPSPTIDTGHRHHFHYKYNRNPTVRESARLQSFPDNFIFCGSKTSQLKQVGNAVPPIMAEEIAKSLKKAIERA